MPNAEKLFEYATQLGGYLFILVQLQVSNVIIAVMCFKHVEKLSSAFCESLKLMTNALKQLERRYQKMDERLEIVSKCARGGVNDTNRSNSGVNDRNVSSSLENPQGAEADRQAK